MITLKKISNLLVTNRLNNAANFLFEKVIPTPLKNPKLTHYNSALLLKLEINPEELNKQSTLDFFNGDLEFEDVQFTSSTYSGHQFGHFVPRLGDGRAINLFEIKTSLNEYFEFQLKGAGLTPFSRMGDGRAVFRSSVREYLASAHMIALGIKSTEALVIIEGTDIVAREEYESAAIVLRIAESFLRFGHFEFLFYHRMHLELESLVNYVINNYFTSFADNPNRYYLFFQEVTKRTAKLMASWQAIGFCHGVMNTDNFSILGLTIDYGPFGFIENFDLDHICNHSDHEGRYSFGNQPPIGKWNLEKLATAISPLISKEQSDLILSTYEKIFDVEYQRLLRRKLGLISIYENDEALIKVMLNCLVSSKVDYTNFFRGLSSYQVGQMSSFDLPSDFNEFLKLYDERLQLEKSIDEDRKIAMNSVNPKFIMRNYLAQISIEDPSKLEIIFQILSNPFLEWEEYIEWTNPINNKYLNLSISCSS